MIEPQSDVLKRPSPRILRVPSVPGGDFTDLDEVVYEPSDPEYFDFASLLPNAAAGGQSIYVNDDGPYFADESFDISHDGPGVLTMYNPGAPNCNGSQFMITFPMCKPEALDGTHVAFGQVVEGWNILAALEQLGDARQEGDTFQRVTVEACGVVSHGTRVSGGGAAAGAASASARGVVVGGAARSAVTGVVGGSSAAAVGRARADRGSVGAKRSVGHRRGGHVGGAGWGMSGAGRGLRAERVRSMGLSRGVRGGAAARFAYAA